MKKVWLIFFITFINQTLKGQCPSGCSCSPSQLYAPFYLSPEPFTTVYSLQNATIQDTIVICLGNYISSWLPDSQCTAWLYGNNIVYSKRDEPNANTETLVGTNHASYYFSIPNVGIYILTANSWAWDGHSSGPGQYITIRVIDTVQELTLLSNNLSICPDSSTTITAQGDWTHYSWSTGDTTRSISVTTSGLFECIASNSCAIDTAGITIVTLHCCDKSITLTDSICTGSSYSFGDIQLTQSGIYNDTLQTSQGCDSIIALTLTVNPPLQSTISQTICTGNSYLFNGIQLTQNGTYKDTLQTAQGCDSIVTLTLTVNQPLQSTISQTICAGSSVLFNGTNYSASGTFSDTLQTVNGCDSVTSLTLTVLPIAQSNVAQTICEGDVFLFNGMPLSQSGNYIDTIQTSNACEVTILALTVAPLPELVGAQNYFEIEAGDSVTLSACASGDFYEWLTSTGSVTEKKANNAVFSASPKVPLQTYTCIISNETGCADTCAYTVKTNGIYGNIYVPNAFSPNGDGTNDVFQVFGKYIRLQNLTIFNRWGEKVYEVTNASPAWDGTYKGIVQAAGVYTYELTYFSGIQNEAEHLKGTITLIR